MGSPAPPDPCASTNSATARSQSSRGYALGLKRGLALLAAFGVACTLGGAEARGRAAAVGKPVEVVVELKQPSLAVAMGMRARRSPGYLRGLEADQAQLQQRIAAAISALFPSSPNPGVGMVSAL